MSHPFFRDINWADLRNRKLPAPYKPVVQNASDCRNIDKLFTNEKAVETPENTMPNTIARKTEFKQFTYDKDSMIGLSRKNGHAM